MSQITTHVLDTATGTPAKGIQIEFERLDADGVPEPLGRGVTNSDGRVTDLLQEGDILSAGTYRMVFFTGAYLADRVEIPFYPKIKIECTLSGDGQHYHIPLLLSPFGYSTYRGS